MPMKETQVKEKKKALRRRKKRKLNLEGGGCQAMVDLSIQLRTDMFQVSAKKAIKKVHQVHFPRT